jgi:hypothetical protein
MGGEPALAETEDQSPDEGWSTDQLLALAVREATAGEVDDGAYWAPILVLQKKAPEEVWDRVSPLATHRDPRLRALVPDVLRFVGGEARPLQWRTIELFAIMLMEERSPRVIARIGEAFVDLHHADAAIELMYPFRDHPSEEVRGAVVQALLGRQEDRAIAALIELSRDERPSVRNWATFGLGDQLGEPDDESFVDRPDLREALAARLTDPDEETRAEAVLGLALRKDPRALAAVEVELRRGPAFSHYIEAAYFLADPALVPGLRRLLATGDQEALQFWQTNPRYSLDAALLACERTAG